LIQLWSSLKGNVMQCKKWIIIITAIVLVIVLYFAFNFARGVSYYNRGTVYMNEEEYDQAILCFDKAIKINPRFAEAYCNRATTYKNKGEYDKAISDYTRAIEIDPEFAVAYCNRAVVFHSEREYDKAWEDVHKAQSLDYQVPQEFLQSLSDASGREN